MIYSIHSAHTEKREHIAAFTLVETLVAIAILTLSVAGPLYIAGRAALAAKTASEQLTASYLAQEGVEYVRALRDDAYIADYRANTPNLSTVAWSDFLSAVSSCRSADGSSRCTLDPQQPVGSALIVCGTSCSPLYLAGCTITTTGETCTPPNYYTLSSAGTTIQSPYARQIQIIDVSTTDERVVVTITWLFHGVPYSVAVTDHITPWQ